MKRRARLSLLLLALAGSGCPGQLGDPERFFADAGTGAGDLAQACPDVETQLFQMSCTTAGCHSATSKSANLDLQSPMAGKRLLNTPATGGPGLLIDPRTPAESVLLTKLSHSPPFGTSMPPTGVLSAADVACVQSWIQAVVEMGAQ